MRLSGPPTSSFWLELGAMLAAALAIAFLLCVGHVAVNYLNAADDSLLHINPPPEL